MATQGGLKHAATDPSNLDNKREARRRGAAGRAAALRRAPSDSDCSGETADLSADSNDRVRPIPTPVRSSKARSRRRGSEWEVLEGLKDGQRFERRPEVFNGYLHKKRKWPLKGWHKRFFVVDGGILVYARSPTDVARGRLHGSVDVGLSVISAKARRRRIDIDADEFIYHLRAKTPDVFRTWLNVLKAHRLYRQHLLTFGARESVPKIHAPLEDLAPTETSSQSCFDTSSEESSVDELLRIIKEPEQVSPAYSTRISCHTNVPVYYNTESPRTATTSSRVMSFNSKHLQDNHINPNPIKVNHSLCSMNCITRKYQKYFNEVYQPNGNTSNITEAEKQMNCTELDHSSPENTSPYLKSSPVHSYEYCYEQNIKPVFPVFFTPYSKTKHVVKHPAAVEPPKPNPTASLFVFPKNKKCMRSRSSDSPMKRSRKSTNLVKYKNIIDEPRLRKPLSKYMLLSKYYNKATSKSNQSCEVLSDHERRGVERPYSVPTQELHNVILEPTESSDSNKTVEKLMMTLHECRKYSSEESNNRNNLKKCLSQAIKEINNLKLTESDVRPVKKILKYLLERWLNASFAKKQLEVKALNVQSNYHFTKDKSISNVSKYEDRETQFDEQYSIRDLPKTLKSTRSFFKDRQIQELERVLETTVYTCENNNFDQYRDKDIEITRKLMNRLNIMKSEELNVQQELLNPDPSSEYPKMQETFVNLIKDTSFSLDIAKDFLLAYLNVLQTDSNCSCKVFSTHPPLDNKKESKEIACDVQTEAVVTKVSKGILTTIEGDEQTKLFQPSNYEEVGQKYLKDILYKITTVFTNAQTPKSNKDIIQIKANISKGTVKEVLQKDKLMNSKMALEKENLGTADPPVFNYDNISVVRDPDTEGAMSITIKLNNYSESKLGAKTSDIEQTKNLKLPVSRDQVDDIKEIHVNRRISFKNPYVDFEVHHPLRKDTLELRGFSSSSDATSKAYKLNYDYHNQHSFTSLKCSKDTLRPRSAKQHEDFLTSFIKDKLPLTIQSNKQKVGVKSYGEGTSESPIVCAVSSEKSTPTPLDEQFILLLLENLTFLSQHMPSLHKDIKGIYGKLKKKHDKERKTVKLGMELLGKIYKEVNDNETQFDYSPVTKKTKLINSQSEKAVNTDLVKQLSDKETSFFTMVSGLTGIATQTGQDLIKHPKPLTIFDCQTQSSVFLKERSSNLNIEHVYNIDRPRSCRGSQNDHTNWFEQICSKNCAISNAIKLILQNKGSTQNFRIVPDEDGRPTRSTPHSRYDCSGGNQHVHFVLCQADHYKLEKKKKEVLQCGWTLLRQELEETTQKEKNIQKLIKDLKYRKDCDVLQLFVSSRFQMNSSLSESNVEIRNFSDDLHTIYRCKSEPSYSSGLISPTTVRGPQAGFVAGTPGGRLASWIIESGGSLENASRELGQAQLSVQQLQRLLDSIELLQHHHHDTDVSLEGASPNVKKDRRKFGLRKKKSNSKCASIELAPALHVDASASHMALSALTAPPSPGGGASSAPNSAASLPIACAAARPQSLPGAESLTAGAGPASISSLTPDQQLREDFTVLAKDLLATLKGVVSTLVCERGRLRAAVEAGEAAGAPGGAVVAALRTNLSSALHQNSELRSRLSRIHDASDLAEVSSINNSDPVRPFQQSLSFSSSCVSASEFFDAEEHDPPADILPADEAGVIELDGDSSSEAGSLSSEDGSASSDNSEGAMVPAEAEAETEAQRSNGSAEGWRRRTRLPCARPTPGGPSLWNLLYKNIGKDLSQVSMPVTINEPLNMLQRLCEELEYSSLLEAAARAGGAAARMSLVAAFAVSAYAAAAHRAASKPFNPLLAETYEAVRPDRSFRFLAEQVSHHPPISACHAESPHWVFWQEARIKTKFWGKSMEFQPAGRVHVRLLPQGDHYSWNKVTTCVHNLFGGQRWVDQYGDMHIVCHDSDMTCKLQFIKASSWSSSRHEVRGFVTGAGAGAGGRLRLHGRWSEALYAGEPPAARCLWRPGAMPPDHELYYGFTRFAMELNEMEPGLRELLPHTDTRFRPDQRALEEGAVEAAELHKHQLEQAQRERRRADDYHEPCWFRKSVEEGEEMWVFTGEYWKAREAGFPAHNAPRLW